MKPPLKIANIKRIEALLEELISLQKATHKERTKLDVSLLSPRRQELVLTIREQRSVSFDFLARNFRGVPTRTLHYDLKQLCKAGYITKLGTTRGVLYVPGE